MKLIQFVQMETHTEIPVWQSAMVSRHTQMDVVISRIVQFQVLNAHQQVQLVHQLLI
jgi:hypothetical protein